VALGAGELQSKTPNGDGTTTWSWIEDHPTAPYLTSATVGRFDYAETTMTESTTGAVLPIYDAVDSAASADRKADVERAVSRLPSMLNFLSKRFGPYPFDSIGTVADWVPAVGYALENQTKPHFSGDADGPAVSDATLLHEIAHQWMGNSVSARQWTDIWFNEGWATFSEVFWGAKVNEERQSPRQFFHAVITSKPGNFELQPALLDGDPANLFDGFAVYSRPGAMIEGYRQIVGNKRFFAFARKLARRHAYSTIDQRQFIGEAQAASGLGRHERRRLGRYFHQWLELSGKPSLRPSDFR
jgi:aminopeptidase N